MKYSEKTIDELCSVIKTSIIPVASTLYTLYSYSAFDNSRIPELSYGESIKSNKLKVLPNMILFNKLNVQNTRVWNIDEMISENSICSTEFIPLVPSKDIDRDFLFYNLISKACTSAMYGSRNGTSNSQQRIDAKALLAYRIQVPEYETQCKISRILRIIDSKIELNKQINRNLVA